MTYSGEIETISVSIQAIERLAATVRKRNWRVDETCGVSGRERREGYKEYSDGLLPLVCP